MKNELPTLWTSQLITIILLFSIGTAFFPLGLFYTVWPIYPPTITINYSGPFEANLTTVTPIATVDLGFSNTILIIHESVEDTETPVMLLIQNIENDTIVSIPSFGNTTENNTRFIGLHLPLTNYTLQVQRLTNDTLFRCHLDAYHEIPPPSVLRGYPALFASLGVTLYIIAGCLLQNFIKRTKKWTNLTKP